MIGQSISHYQILEKLGEGGMGVVYRAQDTHLGRTVAIKVLSQEAIADADRKRRFVQEAKTASALNHPGIITIYDIDKASGVDFIAMEYVEGKTLDHFTTRRGLGIHEVLKYGIEIAEALAAAHAAGIVHRDLKPGNIMVSNKDHIKVLDFGLAKLTEASERDDVAATQSMALDDSPRTEAGTIVGTVAYMSPEQAGGKKVDRRSDIFSFGSVLYEMVTGVQPFRGDNKISTLAAILHEEPKAARELAPVLPADLDRIITRCLRKDPDRRFQDMGDVRVALQELKEDSESVRLARVAVAEPRPHRVSAWLIAAAMLLAAATAGATWWLARPTLGPQAGSLTRVTSDSGLTWQPALSPDGKLLAYSSDRSGEGNLDIWVQQVSGAEPIRLTRDPADDREPAFSSDGSRIAFRSDREGGGIYVMPALGGEARLIAKDGQRPRFSADDKWIVYWVGSPTSGDPGAPGSAHGYLVASTGGPPRQFQPEFSVIRYPVWSRDGKHVLFWGRREAAATGPGAVDWWVAPVDGGPAVKTGAYDAFRRQDLQDTPFPGEWLPDERALTSADRGDSRDLWQIAIDAATGKVRGEARRVTTGTGIHTQPVAAVTRDDRGRPVARLALSSLIFDLQIWSLPLDANGAKVTGNLQRLTHGPAAAEFGSLSLDAKRLVFARRVAGNRDIWLKDLASGRETDLTPDPGDQYHPRMSADGSKIVYSETKDGKNSIHALTLGPGSTAPRPGLPDKLCDGCYYAWGWSWDGTRILFRDAVPQRPSIVMMDIRSGEKTKLITHSQYNLYQSNFSPDDRWVAFLAFVQSQRAQLFIAPSRANSAPVEQGIPSDWIPATSGEFRDDKPRWSPDGKILYFLSDRDGFRCLWAQRLDPTTKWPAGPPFAIYHFHGANRSMLNVSLAVLEPAVTRDQIMFNLAETTANIWMMELEAQP